MAIHNSRLALLMIAPVRGAKPLQILERILVFGDEGVLMDPSTHKRYSTARGTAVASKALR